MDATRFAGRLKELREAAGLTQKQLAEKAGMGQRTVSTLEQGLSEPVWSTAIALAEALGVDLRAFLEQPAAVPAPKRGRPPKAAAELPAEEAPKRPRGRPRKEK
jgi:transcriptional regulator with XRE-family HTH domain